MVGDGGARAGRETEALPVELGASKARGGFFVVVTTGEEVPDDDLGDPQVDPPDGVRAAARSRGRTH
jgi:hypothetical protein